MKKKLFKYIVIVAGLLLGVYLIIMGYLYYSFKNFSFCDISIQKEISLNEKLKLVHFIYGCGPTADVSNNILITDINYTITENDKGNVTVRNNDGYLDEIDIFVKDKKIVLRFGANREFSLQKKEIEGYDIAYKTE